MKNKKMKVRQVAVTVLAFVMMIVFSACGNANKSAVKVFEQVKNNNSKGIAKYYMGDPKDFSFLQNAYYNESNQTGEHRRLYNSLKKKLLAFTVTEGQRVTSGKEASLRVAFTSYDFSNIMTPEEAAEFKAAIASQDASKLSLASVRSIQQKVDALDKQSSTKYMKIAFQKDGMRWKMKPLDTEVYDALSGGFYSLVK